MTLRFVFFGATLKLILLGFSFSMLMVSCLDMEHKGSRNDIPTKGELEIAIDINDSFMFNQLIARFHELYPQAHIQAKYMSPMQILEGVRDKKINALYINYLFDTAMVRTLESRRIKVRSHIVGNASTAFIVNRNNPNDGLSVDSLLGILSGKVTCWKGQTVPMELVFVKGDLAFNYLSNWYTRHPKGQSDVKIKQWLQLPHPQAVFRYVQTHKGALGFVGMNWIADRGDTLSKHLRKTVKVLAVQDDSTQAFHFPYQSQVYAKQYPFVAPLMGYDLQGYSGLASGFLAFCCDQSAQILLKKSGLSPAMPPARTIQLMN